MELLIKTLDTYFRQNAPALPFKAKKFLTEIIPWMAILSLFTLINSVASILFSRNYLKTPFIFLLCQIISSALIVAAVRGLFKKTRLSWNLIFYASLVSIIGSLAVLNFISAGITIIISFYILFQIKDVYQA